MVQSSFWLYLWLSYFMDAGSQNQISIRFGNTKEQLMRHLGYTLNAWEALIRNRCSLMLCTSGMSTGSRPLKTMPLIISDCARETPKIAFKAFTITTFCPTKNLQNNSFSKKLSREVIPLWVNYQIKLQEFYTLATRNSKNMMMKDK